MRVPGIPTVRGVATMHRAAKFCVLIFLFVSGVLCVPFKAGRAQGGLPDPGLPGPFAVLIDEYDLGDTAFKPPGFPFPVEMRGSVHYPSGIADMPGQTFPLIIFIHGIHAPCANPVRWPCSPIVPNYHGYDYVAEILASYGYIVVSVSANGITLGSDESTGFGNMARAELIQAHLDLWNSFNTTGAAPFGGRFVGKVDMRRIGTMGHSAGGESVVRHYIYNQQLGAPYTIKGVFALAPTDHSRLLVNDVAFAVMLPYCDGDVRNLEGIHYYDDARYNLPGDRGPKHTLLVMAANHNFFNTIWASGDDGGTSDPYCQAGSPSRLTELQQRAVAAAYISAFFRLYVGGETALAPYLTGIAAPPPSTAPADVVVSYHPPDSPALRRDVNRFLDTGSLTADAPGGTVAEGGLALYGICGGSVNCLSGQSPLRQPHTTPTTVSKPGLTQLALAWEQPGATYTQELPEGQRDISGFQALQFRAGLNYADPRNQPAFSQDLTVTLTDGTGFAASVRASQFSHSLFFPPGRLDAVPRLLLNMVRLPLSAFSNLTLTDVRSITCTFDQTVSGGLMLTDFAFTNPGQLSDAPAGGGGDPGGPHINKVTFSAEAGLMVIKGTGLSGPLTLEVNGVVVTPPLVVKPKASGAKAKVAGSMAALNLRSGLNQIRLRNAAALQSNVFALNL